VSASTAATDRCPRCGGAFRCGVAGSGPCACTGIELSTALQAQLREQFQGCLCLACLACLKTLAQAEVAASANRPASQA
jgi:hypothetical protein